MVRNGEEGKESKGKKNNELGEGEGGRGEAIDYYLFLIFWEDKNGNEKEFGEGGGGEIIMVGRVKRGGKGTKL